MGINKINRSIYWQQTESSPPPVQMPRVPVTHITGGPPCPYYLDTPYPEKSKKQKNQCIRETARPATELSPTHAFGLSDTSSKNIQKQKRKFVFDLTCKIRKKKKKKIFFCFNPQKSKKKKKKKKKKKS